MSLALGQGVEGLPALEHGLVAEEVGELGVGDQRVEGDVEGAGDLEGDFDRGGHLAALVAADDGPGGADHLAQLGLGPAPVPAGLVKSFSEVFGR